MDGRSKLIYLGHMAKIAAMIIALVFSISLSAGSAYAAKKLVAGISATFRTNKVGQMVDLSKAPSYKTAVADFMDRKYGPALAEFENLDQTGFCCDMVHYYMAQCYDNMNQIEPAEMHYQWVVAYSHDPTLQRYSTYGYQKLAYYSTHRSYGGQGNIAAVPRPPAKGFG
jgi:hypothetical protein